MTDLIADRIDYFVSLEPSDPTCYIVNEYKMDNAMNYVKKLNEE